MFATQSGKSYPDFSYLLVSSTSFSSPSAISLFLVHTSTIITELKVMLSLSMSACHDYELTPRTAYTKNSIHPSTASTQDCLSSLHSHHHELTTECSFSFLCASLHDRPPSSSSPWEPRGKVTWSHSHVSESTNQWIESQHPTCHQSTAWKYSSAVAWSRPPKFISKLTQLWSPSSRDHGFQVHLQTHSVTISECLSRFTRSQPPSVSLKTTSKWICKLGRSRPWSVPLSSLDSHFQAHLKLLSSTAYSQSSYTMHR